MKSQLYTIIIGNKYFSGNSICGLKGDHPITLATLRAAGWGSAQLNQCVKSNMEIYDAKYLLGESAFLGMG